MDKQRGHRLHPISNHNQHEYRPHPRSALAATVPLRRFRLDVWHGPKQEARDVDPWTAITVRVPRAGAGKSMLFEQASRSSMLQCHFPNLRIGLSGQVCWQPYGRMEWSALIKWTASCSKPRA